VSTAPDRHRTDAANDPNFRQIVSRSCPIRRSFHNVENFPETLIVYKIPASRFWQIRFAHDGRMISRSARTTLLHEAKQLAARLYEEQTRPTALLTQDQPPPDERLVFGHLAARLLAREAARRDRGEFAALSYKADRLRMEAEILPFFGDRPLNAIDTELIEAFCVHLETRKLSSTTLSLYLMMLRKALKYAHALKLIEAVPTIPKVRIRKRSRGGFTPTEYVRILRTARHRVGETLSPEREAGARQRGFWISAKYRTIPNELPWAIAFMVNSFIRPSDLKTLKHRHVEIVRGPHTYLRLTLPETKAHSAPIVTLRPAVRLYERMRRLQREAGFGHDDDHLFFPGEPDREYALAVLGWLFRQLLEDLGLREGPHGHPRTLYSLRHTAITLRLLYGSGIDMLTLARNARTSVDMIERHYASTLTGERNIGMLQSRRTGMRPTAPPPA
jgi:hypothetical protein